jgi:hypothetical protein
MMVASNFSRRCTNKTVVEGIVPIHHKHPTFAFLCTCLRRQQAGWYFQGPGFRCTVCLCGARAGSLCSYNFRTRREMRSHPAPMPSVIDAERRWPKGTISSATLPRRCCCCGAAHATVPRRSRGGAALPRRYSRLLGRTATASAGARRTSRPSRRNRAQNEHKASITAAVPMRALPAAKLRAVLCGLCHEASLYTTGGRVRRRREC